MSVTNNSYDAHLTHEHLLQLGQSSEVLAIETLVHDYYADIYRLTSAILSDPDEAEDAAQETFIGAAAGLGQYRGHAKVKTWLFAIAINVCRATMRKRKSRDKLKRALLVRQTLRPRTLNPEESALQNEAHQQLWHMVNRLSEKHRLPVILHYVHDLSAAEIAEVLNIREGTVYSRLHHARRKLHGLLARLPTLQSTD